LGAPLWLSVGRLIYYKGLKHAVAALKHVPGKYVVVGTGPLECELRAQAEGLGVADRIVWLGHATQDELVGAYHAATALWFPSIARSEGFGLVQVEALASGCPVINTAIPHSGVAWVSRHEETGLTVGVGDEPAFAQAALRLHQDSNLRAKFAAAGRERVVAEFSHRVMALRSLSFYAAALAEEKAPASAARSS
jgi:rhamnosyl/mannosyltransferase